MTNTFVFCAELEFTNSHYEKIKKVYSIFICMNPPNYRKNTINQYSVKENGLIGNLSDSVEQKGIAKGVTEGIVSSIQKLIESMNWTMEQAMDTLQIPKEERNGYLNMLKKY